MYCSCFESQRTNAPTVFLKNGLKSFAWIGLACTSRDGTIPALGKGTQVLVKRIKITTILVERAIFSTPTHLALKLWCFSERPIDLFPQQKASVV
jgi:hypothetical protein